MLRFRSRDPLLRLGEVSQFFFPKHPIDPDAQFGFRNGVIVVSTSQWRGVGSFEYNAAFLNIIMSPLFADSIKSKTTRNGWLYTYICPGQIKTGWRGPYCSCTHPRRHSRSDSVNKSIRHERVCDLFFRRVFY